MRNTCSTFLNEKTCECKGNKINHFCVCLCKIIGYLSWNRKERGAPLEWVWI